MANNASLNIGATVDKDAVVNGMQGAAAGVRVSTEQMGVYFNEMRGRVNSAWQKISEDTRAGAATVKDESLRIAQASKAVTDAQKELSAALSLVRNKMVDQQVALPLLAAAYDRVRVATLEFKVANEAVAEVSHKAVTDVQATSAAVRSFEGNPGIRAMEVFVGRTLGLGPLLQSIFPLIGAAAFLSILFEGGERMYELEQKGKKAGEELSRAFAEFNEKLSTSNDQLALTNAKLEEEIAKISGHPTNGVAVALAEATVAADRLQDALSADLKALQALLKEKSVSGFEGALAGVAGTATADKKIGDASKALEDQGAAAQSARLKSVDAARAAYDQERAAAGQNQQALKAASDKFHNSQLEADRVFYAAQRRSAEDFARQMRAAATDTAATQARLDNEAKIQRRDRGVKVTPVDLTPERTAYEGAAVAGDRFADRAHESQQNLDDERGVGAAKQAKEGQTQANKAAEERLRALELEYDGLKERHGVVLKEEHDFWAQRVDEFRKGSEQYKQVQDKIAQIDVEGAAKAHESLKKLMESEKAGSAADPAASEAVRKALEDVNRLQREQAEDVLRAGERWQGYNAAVAKGAEIAAKLQESMEEGRLRILEQEGAISSLGAAQAQARIHAEEHARALKALRDELVALQAVGAGLKPGDKGYEQNATQQRNVQNQITQEQGQAKTQGQADQGAINAAIAKPYLTAFDSINAGWMKVQRDLIQGNRNIRRDFAQMGLNLVQESAKWAEGVLANELKHLIRSQTAHIAANQVKVASDAAAAAESTSIVQAEGLKQALINAKSSAVSGWKAGMALPFPENLIAAPALAAVGFAGAISRFESGGIVGAGGGTYQMGVPILAEAGERVLSYQQTQNFDRMVSSPSGNAHQAIHMGNHTYNGSGGGDFMKELQRNQMKLVKVLKRLKREGHI